MTHALLIALALAAAPSPPAESAVRAQARAVEATTWVPTTKEEKAAAAAALFHAWSLDPVRFVREVLKVEPQKWQEQVLLALLNEPRIAMAACKGPGKSACMAWIGWWILACHPGAQGNCLSITGKNLKDGLWKELAFWLQNAPMLQQMFVQNSDAIRSRQTPDTWFLTARSFPQVADAEAQANTLAGLHAPFVFYLLDEVGDYPVGVISAAKGIEATVGQRTWIVCAGNPTTVDGALYHVCHVDPGWWVKHISGDPLDPNRSPFINMKWAEAEIKLLGRNNPWVMVNILGLFPPAGSNQLIGVNDVTVAMQNDVPALAVRGEAVIWGLDPARSERSGADEAALARRQGVIARPFHTWRGMNGTQLGDAVAKLILNEMAKPDGEVPDAIFVDVGGVGASAFDRLVHLGWDEIVIPIDFGQSADQDEKFANKRTEMWDNMATWIQTMGACLPTDAVLRVELPSPRYWFRVINKMTKFILESKDEMKDRGARSPNRGDALALTFAAPVQPKGRWAKTQEERSGRPSSASSDYDPLERAEAA